MRRFVEGTFDDKYLSTIGVKISRRTLELDNKTVNLLIWDLAGGDDNIRSSNNYLLGSTGAVIVCDLTREETLAIAEQYVLQVKELNAAIKIVLLANKRDIVERRQIDADQLASFAEQFENVVALETSAKTGENVELAFATLAEQLVN